MACFRVCVRNAILNNAKDFIGLQKRFLQFPLNFEKPKFNKEEIKQLKGEKVENMKHTHFLPATGYNTSSEFYDELTQKFIRYIMRDGKKELARRLMSQTYDNIKRIQVKKYNLAAPEDKESIDLDPKVILAKAVENACPVMVLSPMKRGGITYQVPVPLTAKRSKFIGMNWILQAGKDKDSSVRLTTKLAQEIIDTAENKGRVINKKKDLYKQCETNRAYAHYRWM